jgi:hypothetical protein
MDLARDRLAGTETDMSHPVDSAGVGVYYHVPDPF